MIVVFDNNAYSGTGAARLQRIMAAEAALGVCPLASLAVAQELLAGVRDADERRRRRTRAALARLCEHCGDKTGEQPVVRFLADVDSQISQLVRGTAPPVGTGLLEIFGGLVGAVVDAGPEASLDEYAEDLDLVADHVRARESEYASSMRVLADTIFQGQITLEGYRALAPRLLVLRAIAREPDLVHDPERVAAAVALVNGVCAVGLELHLSTVQLVMAGKNIDADANTLWDEEISCATSVQTCIEGARVLLVTEEGKLRRAAAAVGAGDRVISIADYEKLLGL